MVEVKNAAVIGAGVMGSAIAAHLANAGVATSLMDVVPQGAPSRNIVAERAIERLLASEPPAFMHSRAARLVRPANVEDDLGLLGGADWIIEAIVEELEAKKELYRKIERFRKEGSIVSSNTSTLPLSRLTEGMPERFQRDFLITHFFNPPRYLRLLEVVGGPRTRPEAIAAVREFADRRLGKTVLLCRDTPGFVANRVGAFWLLAAVTAAQAIGLKIEEADALMSSALGVPRTGVFGLLDFIGLDLVLAIDRNLAASLPPDDAYLRQRGGLSLLARLVEEGCTGRRGKGGFYRARPDGESSIGEVLDLASGGYRPAERPLMESLEAGEALGLRGLVEHPDKGGRYVRELLSRTLTYAATVAPEIADSISVIDQAMKLGYAWKRGPFELVDHLGAAYVVEKLRTEREQVPALLEAAARLEGFYRVRGGRLQCLSFDLGYADVRRGDGVLLLSDVKRLRQPLARNGSASLWDIGEGVVCLEMHTKMNTIDPEVLAMLRKALEIVPRGFKALVIYSDGEPFCAGFNLALLLLVANVAAWSMAEEIVAHGQETFKALKYAPFPVVGAPSGLALGGGCELLLHCDGVQAHAESYIGLVEAALGLIPAWGGCKELLMRLASDPNRPSGPMAAAMAAYETIGSAKVSSSAFEARELGFLRPRDGITFNRDRLLAEAKAKALELAEGYRPPEPARLSLAGPSGKAALALALSDLEAKGKLTPHDREVADALAEVLTGGPHADPTEPVSEEEILARERAAFMRLVRSEATLARIEHRLEKGKPLRN